jgi:hypothetical protein
VTLVLSTNIDVDRKIMKRRKILPIKLELLLLE